MKVKSQLVHWWQSQARLTPAAQSLGFKLLTEPLSRLYGWGVKRAAVMASKASSEGRMSMASQHLPGLTISVGNIAVGGTGKSPVTIALARYFLKHGGSPAILTRGYGSDMANDDSLALLNGQVSMAPYGKSSESRIPDEARMQSVALPTVPVIAGARRFLAAQRYMQEISAAPVTHWLLDDGFQHRVLHRDLDLVLLDAAAPFGNSCLLPRGILRESAESLTRAQVVLLTRWTPEVQWQEASVQAVYKGPLLRCPFVTGDWQRLTNMTLTAATADDLRLLRSGRVLLVAGIAYPERLQAELLANGLQIQSTYFVSDHETFSHEALDKKNHKIDAIITTAKDYWRDPAFFANCKIPVFWQPLDAQLPEAELERLFIKFGRKDN